MDDPIEYDEYGLPTRLVPRRERPNKGDNGDPSEWVFPFVFLCSTALAYVVGSFGSIGSIALFYGPIGNAILAVGCALFVVFGFAGDWASKALHVVLIFVSAFFSSVALLVATVLGFHGC